MISITEKENDEKIKLYDTRNRKLWGMANIFPYYFDSLTPAEKYDMMRGLEEKKKELEAEHEI